MSIISIVVPVYNVEKYLNRCVDSILRQTFSDFELILVDDGSPDNCGVICDAYAEKDPRVTVIHQPNGGLSAARNAGLDYIFAHADSEWISFIDSDDWVHPAYLERLYSAVTELQTTVSVCRLLKTDGTIHDSNTVSSEPQRRGPEDLLCNDRGTAVVACGKLYAKPLFVEMRFPFARIHEDEFVTYRLLFSSAAIAFVPDKLYYYYQNPDGITGQSKWTPKKADATEALFAQCSFFHKNDFHQAEIQTAGLLLENALVTLTHLCQDYPQETKRIKTTRRILRQTIRKYGEELRILSLPYGHACFRYAFPLRTKLKKRIRRFLWLK